MGRRKARADDDDAYIDNYAGKRWNSGRIKLRTTITFDLEGQSTMRGIDKTELRAYIKDAIETWGGQRHPHDWLFYTIKKLQLSAIEQVTPEDGQP